jgi:hypothetical protein
MYAIAPGKLNEWALGNDLDSTEQYFFSLIEICPSLLKTIRYNFTGYYSIYDTLREEKNNAFFTYYC